MRRLLPNRPGVILAVIASLAVLTAGASAATTYLITSKSQIAPRVLNELEKPGPVGATGHRGATGATGKTGVRGATGATGATGRAGAAGPAGPSGVAGPAGAAGAAGPTGAAGPSGPAGPAGGAGSTGATGTFNAADVTDTEGTATVIPAGGAATLASVTCAGSAALGGGYQVSGAPTSLQVLSEIPTGNSWDVTFSNADPTNPVTVEAWAVCTTS
jgi:hypothetical protein